VSDQPKNTESGLPPEHRLFENVSRTERYDVRVTVNAGTDFTALGKGLTSSCLDRAVKANSRECPSRFTGRRRKAAEEAW
jgi:hypothetical protein